MKTKGVYFLGYNPTPWSRELPNGLEIYQREDEHAPIPTDGSPNQFNATEVVKAAGFTFGDGYGEKSVESFAGFVIRNRNLHIAAAESLARTVSSKLC